MTAIQTIICVDFEPGIPGGGIARAIAAALDLPCVDREITSHAARKLQLSEACVAALEGEPDHPIERWLVAAAEGDQAIGLTSRTTVQSDPVMQSRRPIVNAIREATRELATRSCVIAGHDSAYTLAGRSDAISVLLTARRERREMLLREETRSIDQLDRAKRAYIKQAYGRCWPDLDLYQLALDVGDLSIDSASDLVATFVRTIDWRP